MEFAGQWRALRQQYADFLGPAREPAQVPTVSFAAPQGQFDLSAMRDMRKARVSAT